MNGSIREQLAVLFDRRNEGVHTAPSMTFSASFRQLAEEHSIDINEFGTLLDRGMRPGKALRRLLEQSIKAVARRDAEQHYGSGEEYKREREAYVTGYIKSMPVDSIVGNLVGALKSEPEEVHFATMDFEIEWVYRHGPVSCMVDSDAAKIAGICYSSNPHVAVAWVAGVETSKPAARCIVNLATRKYGRLYGDRSQVLEWGLKELGYQESLYDSPLIGERLFVPTEMRKEVSEWPAFVTVQGYPFPSADPRLAQLGVTEPGTWHGEITMHETRRSMTIHAPYIDNATYLVGTTHWEWKEFGVKKYFGNWMEVVDWEVRMQGDVQKIVGKMGLEVLPQPDHTDEIWEFAAHAGAMEFMTFAATIIPKEWMWEDITA